MCSVQRFLTTLFAATLLLLGAISNGTALAATSTPTADFTDNRDGTVTHKTTGLTWKRCAEGQTWAASTCNGTAQAYTWNAAMALGSSGWGLPTLDQLKTIVETGHGSPAINQTVFPNTPASYFWSASANANNSGYAWDVGFGNGLDGSGNKTYARHVRLVRGGQSVGTSSTPTTSAIYTRDTVLPTTDSSFYKPITYSSGQLSVRIPNIDLPYDFQNTLPSGQFARIQVLVPPGASDASLTIEAAYGYGVTWIATKNDLPYCGAGVKSNSLATCIADSDMYANLPVSTALFPIRNAETGALLEPRTTFQEACFRYVVLRAGSQGFNFHTVNIAFNITDPAKYNEWRSKRPWASPGATGDTWGLGASCGDTSTPPTTTSTTTSAISDARVFAYAEGNFPSIFSGTPTTGQYQQYNYRYYPSSANYLALDSTSNIYIVGPYTSGVMKSVGNSATYAAAIQAWETTPKPTTTTTPTTTATPLPDYTDNGDGTVTHKLTGLTWMRCSMGQTWTGSTCSGTAGTYKWDAAMALTPGYAGKSDWRLPTPWELVTIVDYAAWGPAINLTVFPGTPSKPMSQQHAPDGYFWTAFTHPGISTMAIIVDSYSGSTYIHDKVDPLLVRLVRGGPPLDPMTTPSSDFADNGDGTVIHKRTNLVWKRCSEGQSWIGSTCSGTASSVTYDQALNLTSSFAGKSDWRLPTIQELASISEFGNEHANTAVFPNGPSNLWSATSYDAYYRLIMQLSNSNALTNDKAWLVHGSHVIINNRVQTFNAFLVRGVQSPPLPASSYPSTSIPSSPGGTSPSQPVSPGGTTPGSTGTGGQCGMSGYAGPQDDPQIWTLCATAYYYSCTGNARGVTASCAQLDVALTIDGKTAAQYCPNYCR